MLQLTPKEIDLIHEAIVEFGTPDDRRIWTEWLRDNPLPQRTPRSISTSDAVARIIFRVVRSYNLSVVARIKSSTLDEDAVADIANDLTVTEALERDLSREFETRGDGEG